MLDELRLVKGIELDEPGGEDAVVSPMRKDRLAEKPFGPDRDVEFLVEFADEGFLVAFAGLDLAAREFPASAEAARGAPFSDEGLALVYQNPGY